MFVSVDGMFNSFLLGGGSALDSQGAYMEAAELYEKAAKGKLKVEAYEALIPIYTELNAHESALREV